MRALQLLPLTVLLAACYGSSDTPTQGPAPDVPVTQPDPVVEPVVEPVITPIQAPELVSYGIAEVEQGWDTSQGFAQPVWQVSLRVLWDTAPDAQVLLYVNTVLELTTAGIGEYVIDMIYPRNIPATLTAGEVVNLGAPLVEVEVTGGERQTVLFMLGEQ